MDRSSRTESNRAEELTERGIEDAREPTDAVRSGARIATFSVVGLTFLVLVLMQVTRVLSTSSPYGNATFADWLLLAVVGVAFVGAVMLARRT